MICDVFGLPVHLDAPFDFAFLGRYGRPFCVFDERGSGNICFGMEGGKWGKLLIKFAGAPAAGARVTPEDAVLTLKRAMPRYELLQSHPALAALRGHGDVAGGYAAIFTWVEGENLYPGTRFKPDERFTNPSSPQFRLQHQPLLTKLRMLDRVFDFHAFALSRGYAAGDFYDGNLIADFNTGDIRVIDIDGYYAMPAVNETGRLPGSARFLSPEEYAAGAPLDGLSTQYNMGALAFAFFGDCGRRERASWMAGERLYLVAARACSEARGERYPSYEAFLAAWRQAAGDVAEEFFVFG